MGRGSVPRAPIQTRSDARRDSICRGRRDSRARLLAQGLAQSGPVDAAWAEALAAFCDDGLLATARFRGRSLTPLWRRAVWNSCEHHEAHMRAIRTWKEQR